MQRVAFVLPYGELSDGFFPDTLLGLLCADARTAGHEASMVRVYYDGAREAGNTEVARRLEQWLERKRVSVVVVERLFDSSPIRAHVERTGGACIQVTRGDSVEPIDGVDVIVGADPGTTKSGATRRTPTVAELRAEFDHWLASYDANPTLERRDGTPLIVPTRPTTGTTWRFEPVAEHDVISLHPPPRVERKALMGNVGCPFALDPLQNRHYRGIAYPPTLPIARRGCAFCSMGGDYEKRPHEQVVSDLVAQALHFNRVAPDVREFVLTDQYPVRYLPTLLRTAHDAGVRPARWLFAARADAFVRDVEEITNGVRAARDTGNRLEVYLSGFEAFSDAELERYNKGMTVEDSLAAVAAMRALACEYPDAFDYARARGHSLILWNPWTTPEDLRDSTRVIRRHGLRELFFDMGRNRLRLYRDLPIFYAAERDGAVTAEWSHGDEGAGRRKGYNPELPWRFLDERTRLAYELAAALRDALGAESEVAQLRAASGFARRAAPGAHANAVAKVMRDLDELRTALASIASPQTRPDGLRKARNERGVSALFAGSCNNACASCSNRDTWMADSPSAIAARVEHARAGGEPVVLAGREPTLHPAFLEAVRLARGIDRRHVGVVSNGRRFAYPSFVRAAIASGLSSASIKLFGATAAISDGITRDDGAHDQAIAGLRSLVATRGMGVELRLPMHRDALSSLRDCADVARSSGVGAARVEVALDAVGLDRLPEAVRALSALVERCIERGIALEASPLEASTRLFDWMALPTDGK